MREIVVSFDPALFEIWKSGQLPREWAAKYKKIFDADDLRLALSQPNYHFAEWFAIYWYNRGWRCLVEQYPYSTHPKKRTVLEKFLSPGQLELLHRKGTQVPDLFVYKPETKQFFFCEVKLPGDKVRLPQKKYFSTLERQLGTEVVILQLTRERA